MERYVILKKLCNEDCVLSMSKNQDVVLRFKKGVNLRWFMEQCQKLSRLMKVRVQLT
jgi:hypothetical protein